MRISDALLLTAVLLVAGCDRSDPRVAAGAVTAAESARGRIACRLGDGTTFETVCTAERTKTAGGTLLTLRGPDGGFHRISLDDDGRTVSATDGAEPAVVTMANATMEVAVAGDRYRLPLR